MKKAFSLILVLTLLLSTTAFAQSSVVNSFAIDGNVILHEDSGRLLVKKPDSSTYVLMSADGTELTTAPYIDISFSGSLLKVYVENSLNNLGLINGDGVEVMPMQYGDIISISDRWQLGVVLEPSTVDNYDYKSYNGESFFLVSAYDVYYNGTKVGTLGRNDYYVAYAYGSFLYVKDKTNTYSYYDSAFNKSAYVGDGLSLEYEENYSDHTVWHRGSNQQAFAPGCTLTPDDVSVSIHEINNQFFDLQGNLLFSAVSPYDSVEKFTGEYARVRAYGKYGLIDRTGKEVIPCQYDSISCYNDYFGVGYQIVVKDDKVGYVDLNGTETTEFKYSSSVANAYSSPFTSLEDLDGSVIVISAAVGELPERYAEVYYSGNKDSCPVLIVENMNGQAGVIDLYGNQVIPLDGTYDDVYDLSISDDGTVIFGRSVDGVKTVYTIAHTAAETAAPIGEATAEAPVANENWVCPGCSAENSGNFCTNCGTPRPEAPAGCTNCGYVPEGEMPNFCPECGTKLGA